MDELADGDIGIAGASARRQAERLRQRAETAKASRSRFASALLGPPAEARQLASRQKRWAVGARGEEIVAQSLLRRCPGVLLLHDRRIGGGRANIDHLAVAGTGVYVIDAKRYRGKIEVRAPVFGKPKLIIAGRDRTKLVDGLRRQVVAVEAVLRDLAPEVPVHGCFCFLNPEGLLAESGLPLLRTLSIGGFPLYYPRRLAKRLNCAGALGAERATQVHVALARGLSPA